MKFRETHRDGKPDRMIMWAQSSRIPREKRLLFNGAALDIRYHKTYHENGECHMKSRIYEGDEQKYHPKVGAVKLVPLSQIDHPVRFINKSTIMIFPSMLNFYKRIDSPSDRFIEIPIPNDYWGFVPIEAYVVPSGEVTENSKDFTPEYTAFYWRSVNPNIEIRVYHGIHYSAK